MKEVSSEILIDLARLLKRYPPEAWEEVLHILEDRRTIEKLIFFARNMQHLAHQVKHVPDAPLFSIEESRPSFQEEFERAHVLSLLRSDLSKKPLAQLRDVARSLMIRSDFPGKKPAVIKRIMEELSTLPPKELQKKLPRHLMNSARSAEEYERWVTLIMGKYAK